MKTEVIMKRELFGRPISQKSKSGYFSATELVNAGNAWRMSKGMKLFHFDRWVQGDAAKEFIAALS